jgi:putative nucleotidyltransferase with HDIG domain
VQRLEFTELVEPEVFAAFLEELLERLAPAEGSSALVRQVREGGIRYGAVRVRGEAAADPAPMPRTATLGYHLGEEVQAVRWIHDRVETAADLPLLEADTVVRSLAMAMRAQGEIVLPLLELKSFDQYTTTHSLNVAVLAMALAERRGLSAADVRAFGVAGLLHDLGKVRIPREILVKPGALTEAERAVMRRHPADGARLVLERERRLDLAAVVAYEHHIMIDGRGYPELRFRRDCHVASRLVHVCDVYDALRTRRPYREAWESERTLAYLEAHAGTEFDPELVRDFVAMMRGYGVDQLEVPE